jgi:HEAT repeat protein
MEQKIGRRSYDHVGVQARVLAIKSMPQHDRKNLVGAIKRSLTDRSPTVRAAALDLVREADVNEVEDQVRKTLLDKHRSVRYTAVETLGALHEDEGIAARWLYPLLEDPFPLVRVEALEALVRIGDRQALNLITKRLDDNDGLVRSYAAWSIAQLGGTRYVSKIIQRASTENDDIAKVGMVDALFTLGDKTQFPRLLEFLFSDDYLVRCAAANALGAAKLTAKQLRAAIQAVTYAAEHPLVRGDKTTMEKVLKELQGEA